MVTNNNSIIYQNLQSLIKYSEGGILSHQLVKSTTVDVSLFSMAAGTSMSGHTSTKKAIVHVLAGKGIFNIEGKDIPMTEGVFFEMDKNTVHSLKAIENVSFLLILCAD